MKWMTFGSWPSTHDRDLWLDSDDDTYAALRAWAGVGDYDEIFTRQFCDIPLPTQLLDHAIRLAEGLPLDLFLDPWAGLLLGRRLG